MSEMNYSVIVPYRDKYDLFVAAVESIPDREDVQIIIVDNSIESLPSDKIPEKKNAIVTYTTSSSTGGAGCARNVGLSFVRGRYLLFLDADDYFTKEAFAAFDRYLEKDYDIVFFNTTSIHLSEVVSPHVIRSIPSIFLIGTRVIMRIGSVTGGRSPGGNCIDQSSS